MSLILSGVAGSSTAVFLDEEGGGVVVLMTVEAEVKYLLGVNGYNRQR